MVKNEEYKYSDITEKIIRCAMKVHSSLGNGFPEVIYQRCLEIELKKCAVKIKREVEMPIFYEGKNVGSRIADFLIENKVLIELKATSD